MMLKPHISSLSFEIYASDIFSDLCGYSVDVRISCGISHRESALNLCCVCQVQVSRCSNFVNDNIIQSRDIALHIETNAQLVKASLTCSTCIFQVLVQHSRPRVFDLSTSGFKRSTSASLHGSGLQSRLSDQGLRSWNQSSKCGCSCSWWC